MNLVNIPIGAIHIRRDLSRTRRNRVFEDHLAASIREVGLVEPLKVAPLDSGDYAVIDGVLRLEAIHRIRKDDPSQFLEVPAYVFPFDARFELRYQTDVFQELLPSQLATLVEHLHEKEKVPKGDIARFIGISPATLRNYTGLWRLIQRGGLFAQVVRLMDLGIFPASNPFAWLRLNTSGIGLVFREHFCIESDLDEWIAQLNGLSAAGRPIRYSVLFVEEVTGSLPPHCYRERLEIRSMKKSLGELRSKSLTSGASNDQPSSPRVKQACRKLRSIQQGSNDPVVRIAAKALERSLK